MRHFLIAIYRNENYSVIYLILCVTRVYYLFHFMGHFVSYKGKGMPVFFSITEQHMVGT